MVGNWAKVVLCTLVCQMCYKNSCFGVVSYCKVMPVAFSAGMLTQEIQEITVNLWERELLVFLSREIICHNITQIQHHDGDRKEICPKNWRIGSSTQKTTSLLNYLLQHESYSFNYRTQGHSDLISKEVLCSGSGWASHCLLVQTMLLDFSRVCWHTPLDSLALNLAATIRPKAKINMRRGSTREIHLCCTVHSNGKTAQ